MDLRPLFSACLVLIAVAVAGAAEPLEQHPGVGDRVSGWRERMDLFDVPGAAVAVVDGDRTWLATFGVRDVAGQPVTGDTRFYIASITKTYLATALAMLAEEGSLGLDDPVSRHLPALDLADDTLEASMTVRDLLAHRPGLRSREIVLLDAYTGEITEERYYHWLQRAQANGETRYSNVHYTLAGRVLEAVAGRDWRDLLDRRLFSPAGLERTSGYASELYRDPDSATPLQRHGDGWRPVAQRKTDRTMHAAGGLGTTALDAARYLHLHLDDGRVGERRLFSPETARAIRSRQSTHAPDGSLRIVDGFGLGWQIGTFNGVPLLGHGGGYDGAAAYFALLPEQDAGIAVLVNGGGFARGWSDAVAIDLLEALTGTVAEWQPWDCFTVRATEAKAKRAASNGDATPAVPALELSRPVGLYTGAYHNPWLGTLIVTRNGGHLQLHLGDAPVEFAPAGRDALLLTDMTEPPARLTFVVEPHGRIERVRVDEQDWGEVLFAR